MRAANGELGSVRTLVRWVSANTDSVTDSFDGAEVVVSAEEGVDRVGVDCIGKGLG